LFNFSFCCLHLPVSRISSINQAARASTDIKSRNKLKSLLGVKGGGDMNECLPVRFEPVQINDLYRVDFDSSILEIIGEVKYLEQLGFNVPLLARNVAMLEDVFVMNVGELNHMLKKYYSTLTLLDDVQVSTV
jgi:hypothetical protein